MSETPLPPESPGSELPNSSGAEPSGTPHPPSGDSNAPEPATPRTEKFVWWRSPGVIAIIAAVLVLIAGGIVLAVQGGGTDSGVDACKFLASGSGSTATAAQIEQAREQFAGSDDAALRTSGVDLMDIVAKLQASGVTDAGTMENLGRIMTDYGALTAACAKHGVTLPAIFSDQSGAPPVETPTPSEPTPSEEPSASAGTGTIGQPFVFHTSGGTPTTGQPTPADVTLTINPLTCGIKGFDIPADESIGEPAKTINAPEGMRYCEAAVIVKNTDKAPVGQLTFGGQLTTTDGTVYNHDDQVTTADGGYVTSHNSETYGDNTTPELNPGQKAYTAIVWAIPTGAAPSQLTLTENSTTDPSTGGTLTAIVTVDPAQITWRHPQGQ